MPLQFDVHGPGARRLPEDDRPGGSGTEGSGTGGSGTGEGDQGSALAAAIDGLHEGLFLCDVLGRVTYANPALRGSLGEALPSGTAPGDGPVGRHWGPLFVEESRRRIEREGLPAILRDGHWRAAVALAGTGGAALPAMLSLSAGRRGGLVGLLGLGPDAVQGLGSQAQTGGASAGVLAGALAGESAQSALVTRAEARGERLDALRRLAGDMAHDMNNVLTSIVGYARFLTEDLDKHSTQHGFAEQIALATRRAKQMIDEALAFARPGKGERKAVPVGPVVERACETLRAALPAGSTLRIRGAGDLAVEAEPALFAGVVGHLLTNAAEALDGRPGTIEIAWQPLADRASLAGLGKPGEPVRVTIERQAGSERLHAAAGTPEPGARLLELVVRDSGVGMTEAVLEHAFEPFFTTRQPAKGRGLGLSSVFGQATGQGGALLVDSAPGQGTTVRLLWPAAAVEPPAAAGPSSTESAGGTPGGATGGPGGAPGLQARPARRPLPKGQGQRILVAEDDRVLREALGEMLQRLGYKPVLVNDGEIARQVLAEGGAVEAVLTDRRMPNLSGTELIDWMRAEGLRHPVLLCTGYGEDLNTAKLARAGGVSVLSKPVDAATLARSLEQLLATPVG